MSTGTDEKLNRLDAWIMREASRIVRDLDFDDIEGIDGEQFTKAVQTVADEFAPSSDPPASFDALLARFREHKEAREAFAENEKFHCAEAAKLEALLVEQFTLQGTQSIKRGGKTFFLQREFSATAKPESKQALVEAMRSLGLDEMIVVQPQRLASYCREMLGNEEALPAEVSPLVNIHEAMRLRMRAS